MPSQNGCQIIRIHIATSHPMPLFFFFSFSLIKRESFVSCPWHIWTSLRRILGAMLIHAILTGCPGTAACDVCKYRGRLMHVLVAKERER